jgi:conjugative relaxase-like TrwC/TraI family protein
MMFTMGKIYDGRTYLDTHLVSNDYYCEGEKVQGQWVGKGAENFGVADNAILPGDQAYENFSTGKTLTGEKLTQRDRGEASTALRFFDFQCSAQKSVSVLAVALGDHRLREAHEKAVITAFAELETFAAYRAGKNRTATKTGNLCAGKFTHDASRALDPQLHTHFVVANCTVGADGQRYALDTILMCKAIRYAGKVYQNELARQVRMLGYKIREKITDKGAIEGFEIDGVSDEICERYSKRRAEVERGIGEFVKKYGRQPTSAEIAIITKETRSSKLQEITTPEVRARQLAQQTATERAGLAALVADSEQTRMSALTVGAEHRCLEFATNHLFERVSVAQGHAVMAEALNQGLGQIDLAELKRQLSDTQKNSLAALDAGDLTGTHFATKEGLLAEKWAVNFVNTTRGRLTTFGDKNLAIELSSGQSLSADQEAAIRGILGCRDQVVSFRGVAGAGKTTTLRQLDKGLAATRKEIIYLAPTNAAKDVLIEEGFNNAFTVSKFLLSAKHKGIKPGAVLVVDESGLNSTRQGVALLRLAEQHNARVIFVGDARQHVSVESGDFLRILETHSKIAKYELSEIHRQEHKAYNVAERQMSAGDVLGGFQKLEALGWVHEEQANYLKKAAQEFLRLSNNGTELTYLKNDRWREKVILVSPTHAEGHLLTDEIRAGMKAAGVLSPGRIYPVAESLNQTVQQKAAVKNYRPGLLVTFTQKIPGFDKSRAYEVVSADRDQKRLCLRNRDGKIRSLKLTRSAAEKIDVAKRREIEVAVGDRILIRANDHAAGLINGNVLTVAGLMPDGSIRTREGKIIPAGFRSITHGYVVTSHVSQGRTCDHVVVAAARMDGKAAYVSTSRGRLDCSVYTPDVAALRHGLPGTGDRTAALDVLTPPEAPLIKDRPGYWIKADYEIMKSQKFRVHKVGKMVGTALRLHRQRQHQRQRMVGISTGIKI